MRISYPGCTEHMQKSDTDLQIGFGKCFGTFGELLQGALPGEERSFLVTLPVTHYSTARFIYLPDSNEIVVFPLHKQKVLNLAKHLYYLFHITGGGIITLQSELAEGKGCASSSADMVSAALAMQSVLGLGFSPDLLAQIMATIEPSDGVMYSGIVSFHHREGKLRHFLGKLPSLTIVAIDEGGEVDTLEFNKCPKRYSRAELQEYECLLLRLEKAVLHGDLSCIGDIATRSAVMNQKILQKKYLDLMLKMLKKYSALGVVVAHSGTYIGLLLNPSSPNYREVLGAVIADLAGYSPSMNIFHTQSF